MNTEIFVKFFTNQMIDQLNNGFDADKHIDVKNEEEVSSMLGDDFWKTLLPKEKKLVKRYLFLKYIDEDATTVRKLFDIKTFEGGKTWYSTDFFYKMQMATDSTGLYVGFGVDYTYQQLLGTDLLITLDKNERSMAKSFLDDFAQAGYCREHMYRVADGVYQFEQKYFYD
jgi:hypothetical protein